MSQMRFFLVALLLAYPDLFLPGVDSSTKLMFTNKCEQTIWPGILSNAGVAPLDTTGFSLERGESKTISAPSSWGGRLWGRTQCTEDSAGQFSCVTGDCGSGKEECAGGNAAPPATLAEFTLDGSGGMDFYDVSLVDGYNLPMLVAPQGGSGVNCTATGCRVDVNGLCPSALKVTSSEGDMVACKSACEAFGDPEYCCSGAFGTPDACKPSSYSMMFKGACPSAYSYAYDDKTSTFTCSGAPDYVITFCPSPNTSQKSSAIEDGGVEEPATGMDNSMVYDGALDVSSGIYRMGSSNVFSFHGVAEAVAIIATMYVIYTTQS